MLDFARYVPNEDLPVNVPAEQDLPIRGVGEAGHFCVVAPKLAHALARGDVPNENGLVAAGGGQEFAIRRKRQGGGPDVTAIEAAQDFPAGVFEQPDLTLPIGGGGYPAG
jgi:hypothetical protein